jgi:hypothetical protein
MKFKQTIKSTLYELGTKRNSPLEFRSTEESETISIEFEGRVIIVDKQDLINCVVNAFYAKNLTDERVRV